MNFIKRILIITTATAALVYLVGWSAQAFGVHSAMFGFLANWLVMAWGAITGQVWEFWLPTGYYQLRTFENKGRVYEYLGIQWFKKLVRRGPLSIFAPNLHTQRKIPSQSKAELTNLQREMCKTETGHLMIGVMVILMAGYTSIKGWWDAAGWLLLFNIPINVYPVMLQRYNRARLQPLLEKTK
jgi:hypothetical protein